MESSVLLVALHTALPQHRFLQVFAIVLGLGTIAHAIHSRSPSNGRGSCTEMGSTCVCLGYSMAGSQSLLLDGECEIQFVSSRPLG